MKGLPRGALVALHIATFVSARAFGSSCDGLERIDIEDVTIESATDIVPARTSIGPTWLTPVDALSRNAVPVKQAFCRVVGRIEREIRFEVWLPPPDAWNGKYLGVGNGGYAGFINYGALAHGLGRGYATGSTDTGHVGTPMDATWAAGHRQRIEDYGHRAQHLMAGVGKRLVAHYYARQPSFSYFMGCSNGGYQGLTEAQRYPQDYDGIVSGAPGTNFIDMSTAVLLNGLRNATDSPGHLSQADMDAAVARMTAACDAKDGVADGLLENPQACNQSYDSLRCRSDDETSCLKPEQLKTLKALYSSITDSRGREIYPPPAFGTPLPVSELERRGKLGADMYRYLVHHDATWDATTFDLARDYAKAQGALSDVLVASDPDLQPFARRGGRLILYHGLSDSGPSPINTIRYFQSVRDTLGSKATDAFFRLFMVPGMYHCAGGPGPDRFGNAGDPPIRDATHDVLMALERWVEDGVAPEKLVAASVRDERVVRTRPLCPYPSHARYIGSGDTDRAESFSCVMPAAGQER